MSEPRPFSEDQAPVAPVPESIPSDGFSPTHSSLAPQENTASGAIPPADPAKAVLGPGSQLGPYQLLDKLGEGGGWVPSTRRGTRSSIGWLR